jgi:hypothetical protein
MPLNRIIVQMAEDARLEIAQSLLYHVSILMLLLVQLKRRIVVVVVIEQGDFFAYV